MDLRHIVRTHNANKRLICVYIYTLNVITYPIPSMFYLIASYIWLVCLIAACMKLYQSHRSYVIYVPVLGSHSWQKAAHLFTYTLKHVDLSWVSGHNVGIILACWLLVWIRGCVGKPMVVGETSWNLHIHNCTIIDLPNCCHWNCRLFPPTPKLGFAWLFDAWKQFLKKIFSQRFPQMVVTDGDDYTMVGSVKKINTKKIQTNMV